MSQGTMVPGVSGSISFSSHRDYFLCKGYIIIYKCNYLGYNMYNQ